MRIRIDDLSSPKIADLLEEHLAEMRAESPAESDHALDLDGLKAPEITFWTAWEESKLLGCAALKELNSNHGEIKSMRTTAAARRHGVASELLVTMLEEAKQRGYGRVSLETGSTPYFHPSRRLYRRHGFEFCRPFADYEKDPNSVFMTKKL